VKIHGVGSSAGSSEAVMTLIAALLSVPKGEQSSVGMRQWES